MEKWVGKVAIVTGASSGIGEETCRQLVDRGLIVIGFARREDRLQKLDTNLKGKSGKFYYVKVDLCSEENILEAFSWVKSTFKSVDILFNNAGYWKSCDLLGNTNDWKQMFETNVLALSICSREAIKIMEEMKIEGHIINNNSIMGHPNSWTFMKDISVYSCTKFSVTAITENLRELMGMKNLPIRVTSISPGFVETEMTSRISEESLTKMGKMQPIDIAEAVIYALSAPQRVNIAEITLRPTKENTLCIMQNSLL